MRLSGPIGEYSRLINNLAVWELFGAWLTSIPIQAYMAESSFKRPLRAQQELNKYDCLTWLPESSSQELSKH